MIVHLNRRTDQVAEIADCLVAQFVKPLYYSRNERNYFVYVGSLDVIIDWAYEFYSQYYPGLNDWESFERSRENIYHSLNRHDFLVAWGNKRMEQFFRVNT